MECQGNKRALLSRFFGIWVTIVMLTMSGNVMSQSVGDEFTVDNIVYKITAVAPENNVAIVRCAGAISSIDVATVTNGGNIYSVSSVKDSAFFINKDLLNVKLPKVLISGNDAFEYCSNLKTVEMPAVIKIGQHSFEHCTSLDSIIFPQLAEIGNYAFFDCISLKELSLPKVITVGSGSFNSCSALENISLPEATFIGAQAFFLTKIKIIDLPKVTTISSYAFNGSSFESISMASITDIPKDTYMGSSLKTISLPNVITIGDGSMCGSSFQSVYLPKVKTIGDEVLQVCDSLKYLDLPEIRHIGLYSFSHCAALKSINMPEITEIDSVTFIGLSSLDTLNLPQVKIIHGGAFNDNNIKTLIIPEALYIDAAFNYSHCLTSFIAPKAKSIGPGAFICCDSLKDVTLPVVESLNFSSFNECKVLTLLRLGAKHPTITSDLFVNCPDLRYLKFVDNNGIELTGTSLIDAINDYKSDNNIFHGYSSSSCLWNGWTFLKYLSDATIEIQQGPFKVNGSEIKPAVSVIYKGTELIEGDDYKITYINNSYVGTGGIIIRGIGLYGKSLNFVFDILGDIEDATIKIGEGSYIADGKQIKPGITVDLFGSTLSDQSDYDVSYGANNVAGTGSITITGKGYCFGTKTVTFSILGNIADAVVNVVGGTFISDGTQIKPNVSASYNSKALVAGTDYDVTYGENISMGIGTITLTGKGDYAGTKTVTFKILGDVKDAKITILKDYFIVNEAQIKPDIMAVYNNKTLASGTDYDVTYGANNTAGTGTITITGKGDFTGTQTVTFTIYKADIAAATVTIKEESFVETGNQIRPVFTVTYNGITLVEGTDYEVTFGPNNVAGTGTIILTGKGDYGGTKTVTFVISAQMTYVSIPKVDGIVTDPEAGAHLVKVGDPFIFRVVPGSELSDTFKYKITVYVDSTTILLPYDVDHYKINAVKTTTTVNIVVTKIVHTAAETIENLTIYALGDQIIIVSPKVEPMYIVSMTGRIMNARDIPSGKTVINGLTRGIYVVKVGNETKKVMLE